MFFAELLEKCRRRAKISFTTIASPFTLYWPLHRREHFTSIRITHLPSAKIKGISLENAHIHKMIVY